MARAGSRRRKAEGRHCGYFGEICIKLRLIVTGFGELREILNFMCILMGRRQGQRQLLIKVKRKPNPLTRVYRNPQSVCINFIRQILAQADLIYCDLSKQ